MFGRCSSPFPSANNNSAKAVQEGEEKSTQWWGTPAGAPHPSLGGVLLGDSIHCGL